VFLAPVLAHAQGDTGSIRGTIYGPQGEAIPYLPVQVTEADSGEFGRDESSTEGQYEVTGLAAGSYTITITTPCCAYLGYESEPITLAAGESKEFEIHMEEGGSFNTVGDDPGNVAAALRGEAVIPDEPPPRLSNGKPDFSGVWLVGADPYPEDVEVYDWVVPIVEERIGNELIDHPHLRCLPGDAPIAGGAAPFIAKFVHKDDLLVILMEDYPGFRQIFIDGREHPEDPNPSWMGHSVAHWEGDTLVVDTVGFNDRGWMWLHPRTEDLHLIERYTRDEYGVMNMNLTVEDPTIYKQPWEANLPFHLTPQEELIEYVCENNKWAEVSSEN
jgi:hypothetical protein